MTQIGKLRHRLTIRSFTEAQDAHGQAIKTYADLDEVWGDVQPLTGRELVDGMQVEAQVDQRFGPWGGVVTGSPTEVADAFAAEARLGAELFVVQFSDFATAATLRLFAREVMPAVRSATRR